MRFRARRLGVAAISLAAAASSIMALPSSSQAAPSAPSAHSAGVVNADSADPSGAGKAAASLQVSFARNTTTSRSVKRRSPGATVGTTPSASRGNALLSFAPTSFFYDDISRAPLDGNSAAIAANVAAQVANHWGGVAAFNAHEWNTTFYRVDRTTPRTRVKWSNCLRFNWTPDGIYTGRKVFVDVPVPTYAVPAPGSDGAMSIYDPVTNTSWEFWKMKKDATGAWQACQGGRIDNVAKANGQYSVGFGVSASGLSMTAGTISAAEAKAGRIDHAMYLAVMKARWFSEFSWPAVRSDGYTKDPTTPLEGQRLRLDPTLNIDALPMSRFAKTVARAAQKHGFIVSDKGGAVALVGEGAQSLRASTGSDPWPAILGGKDYEALRGFPWHRLQVLPKDYGKR